MHQTRYPFPNTHIYEYTTIHKMLQIIQPPLPSHQDDITCIYELQCSVQYHRVRRHTQRHNHCRISFSRILLSRPISRPLTDKTPQCTTSITGTMPAAITPCQCIALFDRGDNVPASSGKTGAQFADNITHNYITCFRHGTYYHAVKPKRLSSPAKAIPLSRVLLSVHTAPSLYSFYPSICFYALR